MSEPESTTCPQCRRTSYNPNDVRERYCGACHQYYDMMPVELVETLMRSRARATPRFDVTIGVDDSRFQSAIYRALQERALSASPPLAHYYVDHDGRVHDVRDQVAEWERSLHQSLQAWREVVEVEASSRRRFEASVDAYVVGQLRDELGQAVPERDPAPCGWHMRDGFRFGGTAVDVELPPAEGGFVLW